MNYYIYIIHTLWIILYGKRHSDTKSIFDSFPKDTGAIDVDLIGLINHLWWLEIKDMF